MKAIAALIVRMARENSAQLSQPGGALFNIEHSNGGLITIPGGMPIRQGNTIIGAIGVSGSSVENDHTVAAAGAAAIS